MSAASAAPSLSHDEELHWLALRMTPGLGTKTAVLLIDRFHTAQAVFRASLSELEAAGVSAGIARSITSGCAFEDAVTQHQRLLDTGTQLVPITSSLYPPRLKEIFDPPPMLYARGRVDLLNTLAIAVVGTRRPTAYGTTAATRLSKDLADAGLTIVSGMASGIDTAAHKAVLDAGGNTIAVFGCGVDELYPAENRKLSEKIIEKGLIVSDFPMGTPPYPQNFPLRNRIISGLSVGVLIVEGGQYSGSAITARLASEQGREVFAVPGNITSKMSWGPNLLIKQGSKLVQDWNDVVVELKPEDRRWLVRECRNRLNLLGENEGESSGGGQTSLDLGPMTEVARVILRALTPDAPVALDHLVETLAPVSPSEIIASLFELELSGMVRQVPGKSFLRVWLE
ncbi:MAG: DNA-processing protein DprA [Acidobacteriota bacterium]